MQQHDQLLNVANAFEAWRATKTFAAAKTPNELRLQAVALLENYPHNTITSTLRISGSNISRWRNEGANTSKNHPTQPQTFIELQPIIEATYDPIDLALNINDTSQLHLQGTISPALLTALIKGLTL